MLLLELTCQSQTFLAVIVAGRNWQWVFIGVRCTVSAIWFSPEGSHWDGRELGLFAGDRATRSLQ